MCVCVRVCCTQQETNRMGVTKQVLQEGNKTDYPKPGDTVCIEYTGYLYDNAKPDKKGTRWVTCC